MRRTTSPLISELMCVHHPTEPSIAETASTFSICSRALTSSPPSSAGSAYR